MRSDSDTTFLCSVHPGFHKLKVKIPFLPTFFSENIFRQAKILCPSPPPCHDATGGKIYRSGHQRSCYYCDWLL